MIKNTTKKTVLAKEKKLCKSILSKTKGLMFSRRIKDEGLVFFFDKSQRVSLHMLFVFFPIDIIFLDEKKRVVEVKESFKPFTFYTSKERIKYLIELPNGTVKKTKISKDDVIRF
ncbi:MAG: DUF192 domain-containing protein [Nanoarchaeota archaeon]|nr:DUF192 domain-containing protein [Nanoarchaeota archaeon]MBU1270336.1 DUF192 domain-containing protein [Nanoarchaeota archaeon]MBU1604651.1 DUF192 domain-containing protein [Nanoarchaeota archaeon]MBU2443128.1 DUF192 domain-containing protein [Nanoarchaeota archaeon]